MQKPTNAKGARKTGTVTSTLRLPCHYVAYSTGARMFSLLNRVLPSISKGHAQLRQRCPSFRRVRLSPSNTCRGLAKGCSRRVSTRSACRGLVSAVFSRVRDCCGRRASKRGFRCISAPLIRTVHCKCVLRVRRPAIVTGPNMLIKLGSLLSHYGDMCLPGKRAVRHRPSAAVMVAAGGSCTNYGRVGRSIVSQVGLIVSLSRPSRSARMRHTVTIAKYGSTGAMHLVAHVIGSVTICYQRGLVASNYYNVERLVS